MNLPNYSFNPSNKFYIFFFVLIFIPILQLIYFLSQKAGVPQKPEIIFFWLFLFILLCFEAVILNFISKNIYSLHIDNRGIQYDIFCKAIGTPFIQWGDIEHITDFHCNGVSTIFIKLRDNYVSRNQALNTRSSMTLAASKFCGDLMIGTNNLKCGHKQLFELLNSFHNSFKGTHQAFD